MVIGTVRRTRLYEEIVRRIQDLINDGTLRPGDKLPTEREMSELFGVSRVAVREAITALEARGLVTVRHGSGVYLREATDALLVEPLAELFLQETDNLLNLLELRKGLEGEAAYLAAQRATATDLESLAQAFKRLEAAVTKGELGDAEDFEFHHILVQSTQNPAFLKVFDVISSAFRRGLQASRGLSRRIPGLPLVVLGEHRRIVEEIRAANAEGARAAVREHLENVEKKILEWTDGLRKDDGHDRGPSQGPASDNRSEKDSHRAGGPAGIRL